jgi:hypothetical protein
VALTGKNYHKAINTRRIQDGTHGGDRRVKALKKDGMNVTIYSDSQYVVKAWKKVG